MAERMCIVTRAVRPPEELVRFVLSPDEEVTPDLKRKLPGRGVWVTACRSDVEQAARKGLFARGFKQKAVCSPDMPDLVDRLLRKEALNLVSLCKRAGLVTTGFENVGAALVKSSVAAILSACDAADDGRQKIASKARVQKTTPEFISFLNRDELSLALGQANVVHAAVRSGDLADHLVRAAKRYSSYNGSSDG